MGSAKGWAAGIRFDRRVRAQFDAFYERKDTFSLGVCNGCQLMALLGWVPFGPTGVAPEAQPRLLRNASGRFESRFSAVRIGASPAVMLRGMEGAVLGVWVAHGEGRLHFPDAEVRRRCEEGGLLPVRYVDDEGAPTEAYPMNPNGSPGGAAAICSPDGRHLAMMPHPERCFLKWQWPWRDATVEACPASPWLRMFENARAWCEEQ